MADLCRALGIVPRGANFETLRAFAIRLGLETDRVPALRWLGTSEEALALAVSASPSMGALLRRVGVPDRSINRRRPPPVAGSSATCATPASTCPTSDTRAPAETEATTDRRGTRPRQAGMQQGPPPPSDRRGDQGGPLRVVPSHQMERCAHPAGTRPHRRRPDRQRSREPAAAVSELPRIHANLPRSQPRTTPRPVATSACRARRVRRAVT
jgi:hypothetical protein